MITLEAVSDNLPNDAAPMLLELGDGDSGFSGTAFGEGKLSMSEYLRLTMRQANAESLPAGWVPQTTFWILENGSAAGLLRMRHRLNENLKVKGGHIGYYVRPSARRKGIGSRALELALREIEHLGILDVMLTTNPDNSGSIRVIEENGGSLTAQVDDPDDGSTINQYWIKLPH